MPTAKRFQHRIINNPAMPYVTNANVTAPGPFWVAGSNILTSIRGVAERRPGFPTYTADNFGANNTIKRFFTWQLWNGAYFVMLCVVDTGANTSKVYKQKVGTDATFVLLFTSAANTEPFDFVVSNNVVYFTNGTDQKRYDGTTLNNWGAAFPTMAAIVNAGAGNVPGAIGHDYVAAFGNAASGYITDISLTVSTTAASRQWTVSGPRSTDAYIDQVHIYRTEDGGSVFYEITGSPIANPGAGSWTITDNSTDAQLSTTQAPFSGVNSKILTTVKGPQFFAGRVWVFAGDTVYYSGLEEVTNGLPEESFPTINQYSFGKEITGLGVTRAYLLVFTADTIFRIAGDALATFTRDVMASHYGCRQRAAIDNQNTMCVWLDSGNTVRVTDGANTQEISIPIRPDIAAIDHTQASIAIYDDGKYHWIVLCDGAAGKLRIFDLDTMQWMPPWAISSCSVVAFGETSGAVGKLFLGRSAKPLAMSLTVWQDETVSYTASLSTNLLAFTPDNPVMLSSMEYFGVERSADTVAPNLTDVGYLVDDDPTTGTYTSIFTAVTTPYERTSGTNLVEKWYWARTPSARRVSVKLTYGAVNEGFKLYTADMAYTTTSEVG